MRCTQCDFEIAVETNGTIAAPAGLDWVCVSPKANAEFIQRTGDELKLVYPQPGAEPENFAALAFRHFFLQPMDGPARAANTELALRYCMAHPQWRLSLADAQDPGDSVNNELDPRCSAIDEPSAAELPVLVRSLAFRASASASQPRAAFPRECSTDKA